MYPRGSGPDQWEAEARVRTRKPPQQRARQMAKVSDFVPNGHINDVARIAHEVNRAYCASIGDDSQPDWEHAPQWQKDSAASGVRFHIDNPHAMASDSHMNWLRDKIKDGWTYGPVKDPEKKQHPCCVPYNQLPQEQQTKDYLFRAVVHATLCTCHEALDTCVMHGRGSDKGQPGD